MKTNHILVSGRLDMIVKDSRIPDRDITATVQIRHGRPWACTCIDFLRSRGEPKACVHLVGLASVLVELLAQAELSDQAKEFLSQSEPEHELLT